MRLLEPLLGHSDLRSQLLRQLVNSKTMAHRLSSYVINILEDDRISGSNRMPRTGDPTRVYWSLSHDRDTSSWTSRELLGEMLPSANKAERYAICIIENISSDWVDQIGHGMKLDPAFFISHFDWRWDTCSHRWHWTVESERRRQPQIVEEDQCWRKLDGTFSLLLQPGTRISYYRLRQTLCKDELCCPRAPAC